ncbi:hypothetical protein [Wenzhouxiangella marina]|uniref:Uncharacterized protein n=1 Tax=Wenzhouxiangella marina TaxID=1579979 RepID=A0A0K0XS49_9GAMM|nr:hypothetical protein [Wenzhouxiangella marina]AKS40451.1 hypothetical protein WM2015_60 [Wenzhouxiangella marina]MBB6088227.1 hypothetical protein [Wenzhouxiangella marina]
MTNSTNKAMDEDMQALARQYREHGQAEPPAGLDRMIRARAEEAVKHRRLKGPLPWMGGLATAAVLVLAIGVVIQTPPPAPEALPEIGAADEGRERFMQDSLQEAESSRVAPMAESRAVLSDRAEPVARSAPPAPPPPAAAERQLSRLQQYSGKTMDSAVEEALVPEREAEFAPEAPALSSSLAPLPEPAERRAADQDALADSAAMELREAELDAGPLEDAVDPAEAIREALEAGRLEDARAAIDALREAQPDHPDLEALEAHWRELAEGD